MKKLLLSLLLSLLVFAGCHGLKQNTYIEGTSFTLGLYVPYNGSLYGLQCINFLSGRKISIATNQEFKVSSEHEIRVLDNIDKSKTEVK